MQNIAIQKCIDDQFLIKSTSLVLSNLFIIKTTKILEIMEPNI